MLKFLTAALVAGAVFSSCADNGKSDNYVRRGAADYIKSVMPESGLQFMEDDWVYFAVELRDENMKVDSILFTVDGVRRMAGGNDTVRRYSYRIAPGHRVGRIPFEIEVFKDSASSLAWGEFIVRTSAVPKKYGYKINNTYPHDKNAYTQGLYWDGGFLYEGTGLNGASSLRKVDLATGRVLQNADLESEFFGEGIALLGGNIYQLTWQSGKGFVYDAANFKRKRTFGYVGEGWGLTTDGELLYMSNGTERITVRDPETFKVVRNIDVYTDEGKVMYLNELEWIDGEIWANVYTENYIVRIDPNTGVVAGTIDLSALREHITVTPDTDVLNGIAFDAANGRVFVTGKNWDKLFEIEVVE